MQRLILIMLLTLVSCFAEIVTTTKISKAEGTGIGSTRSEAVNEAIVEAIGQISGVRIKKKTIVENLEIEDDNGGKLNLKYNAKINKYTSGKADSFKILSVRQRRDGLYKAIVLVVNKKTKRRYKTPGLNPNKRRKLAVFPFEYKNSYVIFNRNEDGKQVSDRFTQSLVTKITQARKFTVLDRENSKYYQAEKNFLLSGNSSKDELLKLGKRLGVDYMVVGKILDLKIGKVTEKNNIGLPETSSLICGATISYRIIAMATQQIKWSETISKEFTIEENSNQKSIEAIVAKANDKISEVILSNILNNIYPPKIVSVTSNSVIVNQGGNSISKGDSFKAYGKGQRLVDPYTKEFLGYEEIEAGEIEITKVNPKVSYARVLRGKVSKGMILRKLESDTNTKFQSDGEAVTDVKINENGGVVLPF